MTLIVEQMIQRKFEKVPAKGSELGKILPLLDSVKVDWTIIATDLAKMEQYRAKQAIEDNAFGDDATKTIFELVKFVQENDSTPSEVLGRLLEQLPGTGWINRVAPILAPKVKEALIKNTKNTRRKYEEKIRRRKEKNKKKRKDSMSYMGSLRA
jgi:hypothetical protein